VDRTPAKLFLQDQRGWFDRGSLLSSLNCDQLPRLSSVVSAFVKALSKILRAGQAPSVTIPRTSHRFDPLAYLRDARNCVFRQL